MCLPIKTKEKISPRDIIRPDQIHFNDRTLSITGINGNVITAGVADTNSMDGLFDYGHSVLLLDTFDKSKLEIGDIIVYQSPNGRIIHRIVKIGEDEHGRWYKCKGDNNWRKDAYVIRDENIIYLCIGFIY